MSFLIILLYFSYSKLILPQFNNYKYSFFSLYSVWSITIICWSTDEFLIKKLLKVRIRNVKLEIIIVESNSTDGTREEAIKFQNYKTPIQQKKLKKL